MNKQEVIDEIENAIPDFLLNAFQRGKEAGLSYALELVNQLDEPEKPVVPQFVADYIEYCKHEKFYALHGAYDNMDDRLKCWRFKGNNTELFAKAWLYGYEVEKEKLYTVEIPNPRATLHFVIRKYEEGEVCISCYNSDNWRDYKCAQLTESEIKQDFEWAWQFAKEVEE